jgi:hypothetical protein
MPGTLVSIFARKGMLLTLRLSCTPANLPLEISLAVAKSTDH